MKPHNQIHNPPRDPAAEPGEASSPISRGLLRVSSGSDFPSQDRIEQFIKNARAE